MTQDNSEKTLFKTSLAKKNWKSKYQYTGETPLGTQVRVIKALAAIEKDSERDYWENEFLRTVVKFDGNGDPVGLKCTFGGRITANVGTAFGGATAMNCFINGAPKNVTISYKRVIPGTDTTIDCVIVTDSTEDSLPNIMLAALEQAETLKSEGGYGLNFDFLRPRASLIKGIGIEHPGVVRFMEIWDKISEIIVSGNNDGYTDELKNYLTEDELNGLRNKLKKEMARKGAMMGCLSIWHPDIEEFIKSKQTPGKLTKFNISVVVDDKFMDAVVNDDLYDLHFNGKVYKRIKARELYNLIMESTYNRAEPGILYYDNMQRNNPLSYLGHVNTVNPCGEVPGNPVTSTVCLLGSINLTQYIREDRTFDWETLEKDIAVFARMLDNVNDVTSASLPQYRWAIENIRQYGMGINGLGSALLMLGIPYNSKEAVAFTDKVTAIKEDICWRTSALLAKEKGPFPAYSEKFLETHWFTTFTKISEDTKELIRKYGVRNGKTTTNPPLGNTSVICDNISNGIEPIFDMSFERTVIVDKWPEGLTLDNVRNILQETQVGDATVWRGDYNGSTYYFEPHNRGLCAIEVVRDYGYQWVLDNYPEDVNNKCDYFVTTRDLKIEDHVAIQEVVQRNCNQSVSKTANIPFEYPFEDFKALYLNAWEKGLNGFTTYRSGTMESVLSTVGEKPKKKRTKKQIRREGVILPDEFINGPGQVVKREGQKFYIHFSYLPDDKDMHHPIAMWIHTNSKGETIAANKAAKKLANLLIESGVKSELVLDQMEKISGNKASDKIAKMVSMCLRHDLQIVDVISALEGFEEDNISTLITCVRKFLSQFVEDGTKVTGKVCTECNSTNIVFESGCNKCQDCGYSGCG